MAKAVESAFRERGAPVSADMSRFRPHQRLHSRREFLRVKREGLRLRSTHFVVSLAPNDLPFHRLGLVVQKRFWKAAKRNRIKRCLREWFRLHHRFIPLPGKDIVIIALPGTERLKMTAMAEELMRALRGGCGPNPC
ncbi:MAG: ribonuclease P protein component [Thermodesulfobacteriota bacterium]|nr:ribonuclease P protein component [Thermodesulfobacteriota bacterium]